MIISLKEIILFSLHFGNNLGSLYAYIVREGDIWRHNETWIVRMIELFAVSHPEELLPMHYVIRMTYDANLNRQDYITRFKTSVIRMTYFQAVSRPDDL